MIKTVKVFESGSSTADILLENTPQNVIAGGEIADLCVVMPGFCDRVCGEYKILLAPQNFECKCKAGKVFSYGMEHKSMVTLSSVGENRCIMTLQEEIENIWGKTIEPQDIVISRMHLEPDAALATAAALMIVGAEKFLCGI